MIQRIRSTTDPFVLLLVATVLLASLLPVRGQAAIWFGHLTNVAIVLLFFLHGAKLSRQALLAGIGHWRLHAIVLASTFLLFPLFGLGLSAGAAKLATPELAAGLLFLTLLPSTVQSSIAFTAIAGGNVPAAVCSASLSNILGIFLTPLLVALLMGGGGGGGGGTAAAIQSIVLQLLAPFLIGHFARPLIGAFIDSHKTLLGPVDRTSILLVVYTAFSAAVVEDLWGRVDLDDLLLILVASAMLLALVMAVNLFVARRLGFSRPDEIAILFCGSKKSLVSGVPMAGVLFPAAAVGMIILPMMIFHQLQLMVCAVIAGRYRASAARAPR